MLALSLSLSLSLSRGISALMIAKFDFRACALRRMVDCSPLDRGGEAKWRVIADGWYGERERERERESAMGL